MKNINNAYKKTINEIIKYYNSSKQGLDNQNVEKNKNKYGSNYIIDTKKKSFLKVFLEQYNNLLVIVLIIASILSLFTGGIENTIVILLVITLNSILGTIQYFKAFKSVEGLKKLISLETNVLRSGNLIKINSNDIVCGDIVYLKYGDIVPADMLIIESQNLEVDESMLTGESNIILKKEELITSDKELSERRNVLFRGTKIISGKAKGIVYATGIDTEIGKINSLMQKIKKKKSPLEKDIDKFSFDLAIIILIICAVVFFMSLYRHITLMDSLMFSISLAVAAIPEALQTIVTIVLAISTEKLAKEKAVVKDIKALETLGCINVLCTDKTGTITKNQMVVSSYFYNYIENDKVTDNLFKEALILCNDVKYDNSSKIINTDGAIINSFNKSEIDEIINKHQRIYDIPFSSKNKYSLTCNLYNNDVYLFVKGASEVLLEKTNLPKNKLNIIKNKINEKSEEGYRVITVCYRKNPLNYNLEDLEFLGLVFIIDPIKEDAFTTINELKKFNVTPIMITGDNPLTALNIARNVGIYDDNYQYITGSDLEKLTDKELKEKVDKIRVYARVSPADKIRIVKALQSKNLNVAFVGDGVNDAPAIRGSNVGISMGISGTEVSKEASDMILMDDNLKTVTKAVKSGRKVYKNIQNSILYLIAGNIAGIFIVLYTTFLNYPIPFAPVHLLFINLINDSLPAIAIGIDDTIKNNDDIMKPRFRNSPILSKRIVRRIVIEGFLIALYTMIAYYIGFKENIYVQRTMVFITITISRLFYSFNCKERISILSKKRNKHINKTLLFSILAGLIIVTALIFIPSLHKPFSIADLNIKQIIISYLLGVCPYITIQFLLFLKEKILKKYKH